MKLIIKTCLLFLVLTAGRALLHAQVLVTPMQVPQKISLDNTFTVQLNNTQPTLITGFIQVKILREGKQLAEINYQQIQLNPGIQTFNTRDLVKTGERITDDDLKQSRTISTGEVNLCIDFINASDNTVMGSQCNTIAHNAEDSTGDKKNKFKLPATFSGYAELSGSYSNRKGSYQELPANYTNVIINPQLEILGVPMGGRFNYSTAADKQQQNMNLFSVYFDADKFRQKLDKKYMTNVAKDYILEKTELGDYKKKAAEYQKLSSILNNPFVKGELDKIGKLDSLTKLIQDSSSYLSADKLTYLKSQRDSLSYLEEKREGYNSLLLKQKNLGAIMDIYNNPMDTQLLKDSLDKLGSRLENTRNPFSADDEQNLNELDSLLSDNKISKQRREILKKQRDALHERKKAKQEYEDLKEKYANLHHTYEYKNRLDSLRGLRKDASSMSKDSIKGIITGNGAKKIKDKLGFLKSVKSFNIGFFAPQTGELTLNGVPIRGAGTELQLGKFFIQVAGGKLQRATLPGNINSSPTPFSRELYTSVIGVGNPTANFLSIQYITAKDAVTTLTVADSNNNFFSNRSGFNQVVATRFRKSFFKNLTIIEGEAAGSQLTNTTTILSENINRGTYTADRWLQNIFSQTNGADFRTGYAYSVSLKQFLNKQRTQLSLSSKKTMDSYTSFGSPFLLTDVYINEARLTQQLWQGKITLAGFYRLTTDNLNNLKTYTTQSKNFGGDLSVRIPKWPSLRVSYTPIMQQTPGNFFNATMLMANSAYGMRKGQYYHQFSAVYINQQSESRIGYNNFNSSTYTLAYLVNYKQVLTFNLTGNYIKQLAATKLKGYSTTLSAGHLYKKKINQVAGLSLTDNTLGNRFTYFYEVTSTLSKYLQLRIRYDRTNYTSTGIYMYDGGYLENLLIFSVISNW